MKQRENKTGKKNFPNNFILFPIFSNIKRILYKETQQQTGVKTMKHNTTQQDFFGVHTMNNSFDQIQSDSVNFSDALAWEMAEQHELEMLEAEPACRRCGEPADDYNVFDLCLDCFRDCGE
jgi:hypothetical protein